METDSVHDDLKEIRERLYVCESYIKFNNIKSINDSVINERITMTMSEIIRNDLIRHNLMDTKDDLTEATSSIEHFREKLIVCESCIRNIHIDLRKINKSLNILFAITILNSISIILLNFIT